MATLTPNYNLIKPDPSDLFGSFLASYNDNLDEIDSLLGGGGGASSLANLSDVTLTTPVTDDALIYDGAEWVNTPLSAVALSGDYADLFNKPTIPTAVSDLNNDLGFTSVSWNQVQASGTKIAEIDIDGTTTDVYAPTGGGGSRHTIVDENGTDMPNEARLQFTGGVTVTDDNVNGVTVVSASGKADKEDLTEIFETGLTASQRILDGSYFYLNDYLCYAIADIEVGDTFTIFSNYRRLTGSGGFGSLNHVRNLFNEKVSKDGDTMTGELDVINRFSTTVIRADYNHSESVSKAALVRIGNDTPDGTEGSTYGRLLLYGKGANYAILSADDVTANRNCYMRDTGGTMALTKDISTVVQDGAVATQAIDFGQRFYRNGVLNRAIANIANGASFTASNCEQTNLNVIGECVNSTSITTTIPTATTTNIRSMTLSRGVWVITGGSGYSASFTQACYIRLRDSAVGNLAGTQVRGTGANGGNLNTSSVYAITAATATIYLQAYQASGSDKTTESPMLKAVRIA